MPEFVMPGPARRNRVEFNGPWVTPAVVVMARAPRRGEVRRALEPEIGPAACLTLHATLLLHTVQWGLEVAPDAVYVAHEPADGAPALRNLLGARARLFPQNGDGITGRMADSVARVYARHPGPVLIVWPDVAQLSAAHATAALGDLRAGADVVIGPAFDGGFYLVGVARPVSELFSLPESAWRGPDSITLVLRAAVDAGLEVGLLRTERALHRPADVRAALADPTLPDRFAVLLAPR